MYWCEAYHFFKYEGNHLANVLSNVVSVMVGECGQVIYAYITSANTQRGGKYIFTQTLCARLWVLLVPVWYACAPMLMTRGKRNREEAQTSLPRPVGSTHFAKDSVWCPVLHMPSRSLSPPFPGPCVLASVPGCPLPRPSGGTSSCLAFAASAAVLTPVWGSRPFNWHCCPLPVRYRNTLIFKPWWTTFESELSFFSSVASSLCNHPVDKPYSLLMDIEH